MSHENGSIESFHRCVRSFLGTSLIEEITMHWPSASRISRTTPVARVVDSTAAVGRSGEAVAGFREFAARDFDTPSK